MKATLEIEVNLKRKQKGDKPRLLMCSYALHLNYTLGNEPELEQYILKRDRLTAPNRDFPFEVIERGGQKYYLMETWERYYDEQGREIYIFRESYEKNVMISILYIERKDEPTIRVEMDTDGRVEFYTLKDGIQGHFPDRAYLNGRLDMWDDDEAGGRYEEFESLYEHGTAVEFDEYGNDKVIEFTDGEPGIAINEYIYTK